MRPPKILKPYVESFARKALKTTGDVDLGYVLSSPLAGCKENDCFCVIEDHVKVNGGEAVLGWAIWEYPNVFIEAELHMIWQSPDGILHDLVPRTPAIPRILFLRDPYRTYKGQQVDNIRKALIRDKSVEALLKLFGKKHSILNAGGLADFHGWMEMPPEIIEIDQEIGQLHSALERKYGAWTPESFL